MHTINSRSTTPETVLDNACHERFPKDSKRLHACFSSPFKIVRKIGVNLYIIGLLVNRYFNQHIVPMVLHSKLTDKCLISFC